MREGVARQVAQAVPREQQVVQPSQPAQRLPAQHRDLVVGQVATIHTHTYLYYIRRQASHRIAESTVRYLRIKTEITNYLQSLII